MSTNGLRISSPQSTSRAAFRNASGSLFEGLEKSGKIDHALARQQTLVVANLFGGNVWRIVEMHHDDSILARREDVRSGTMRRGFWSSGAARHSS
jgi:hypothetical protein